MKEKLRTTSFWLGIGGAVIILIDCLSGIFGFNIAPKMIESIVISICSILVLLGVITKKNVNDKQVYSKDELIDEINDNDLNDDLN